MTENKAARVTKKQNVRIAIRDPQDLATIAYFDNSLPNSIHYNEADLTRFIEGNAAILKLKYRKRHPDANLIKEGCKLAFIYKDQSYWLNIMTTEDIGHYREIVAFSLSLEMNNEENEAYTATSAMTMAQYVNIFNFEKSFEIGVNEVADKKLKLEWTGEQKILSRMFSLASKFDAEIEFVTELNDDYSLKRNVMNIWKKHDDNHQGIGVNSGKTLRVGEEIKVINRKTSIEDYYTAITGTGKDGLSLINHVFEEKDSNGNVLFYSKAGSPHIYAPQARDRIPSLKNHQNDGYILERKGETEYSTIESLKGYLLSELKKNCDPVMEYDVEGYFDSNPGDTFRLVDGIHYNPPLYLEARVSEQTESLVDPKRNKTTFSNFVLKHSELSKSLLDQMQEMIDANKKFDCLIVSDKGIQFVDGKGETTLTASVRDGIIDVTATYNIVWAKDGVEFKTAPSIVVKATDVNEKAVYSYRAVDADGKERGRAEVTITNVVNGKGEDGKTSYVHTAYANSSDGLVDFTIPYPGENLFSTTKFLKDSIAYSANNDIFWIDIVIPKGKSLTASANVPRREDGWFDCWIDNFSAIVNSSVNGFSKDSKRTFTVTESDGRVRIAIRKAIIEKFRTGEYWIKVEIGTVVTIYTPAPADDPIKAKMQYIGQYTDFVATNSTDPSRYTWARFTGENGYVHLAYSDSKDGSSGFGPVQPTENILLNTKYMTTLNYWNKFQTDAEFGLFTHPFYESNSKMLFRLSTQLATEVNAGSNRYPVTPGTWTISFLGFANIFMKGLDVYFLGRKSTSVSNFDTIIQPVSNIKIETSKVQKIEVLIEIPEGVIDGYVRFGNNGTSNTASKSELYFTEIAMRKGDMRGVPYTPAPKDDPLGAILKYCGTASTFDPNPPSNPDLYEWTLNPDWVDKSAQLGLDGKVGNDEYNENQQALWEDIAHRATAAEAEEIRQMAQNLTNAYSAFVSSGGQYETDLENLKSRTVGQIMELADKIAKWTFLDTHMSMGEEGLVIGSDASSLQMILSKDRLAFLDGGETVAYFNNQSFFIKNGVLTDSVQIGGHRIVNMGGGHTSVVYVIQ